MINKGPFGVAACKTLDACPVDASDPQTSLELVAYDPGRMLGRRRQHRSDGVSLTGEVFEAFPAAPL